MNSIHPSIFYLMIEGLVVLTLIAGGLAFFIFKKRNDRNKQLSQLVDNLTANTERRQEELLARLTADQDGASNDLSEEAKSKIFQQETEFYQYMVKLTLAKDPQALLELDRQIESLTDTVIASCRTCMNSEPQQEAIETSQDTDLTPAITNEMAEIRSEIAKIQEQNDVLLSTVKDISTREVVAQETPPESDPEPILEEDNSETVNLDDELDNEIDSLPPLEEVMEEEVIDISDDTEEAVTEPEEEVAASAETAEESNDDITDIDALLDEARDENTSEEIEEIPADLLQQDELSVNDAATDIDALFAEVAQENIEKSADPTSAENNTAEKEAETL